mmetsp:Transcript_24610/g.28161  ORF Transcript_24610/g.28161 Transcript_24610/m.28161 type:complete len:266 (-) Transcript_24610:199-996(-)
MFFIITNVILLLTFPTIHAFTPLSSTTITSSKIPITKINYAKRNHSVLQMAGGGGDFFSAILGQAPKIINVPVVEILQGTNIDPEKSNVDLQCVYKASKDGWSAIDFHNCCDGRGSGLVVVLTNSGKKIGGFNPIGWQSTDDYGTTNAAFLWYINNGGTIKKCPVLSGGNAAVFDYATGGPHFGAADLIIGKPEAAVMGGFAGPDAEDITKSAGSLKRGSVYLGGAYTGSGFPVGGSFNVVEVEVYCNGNIKPSSDGGGFSLWPF